MTRRRVLGILGAVAAAVAVAAAAWLAMAGRGVPLEGARAAGRPPRLRPDCAGVVVPPNIAPLNFLVEEPGEAYAAVFRAAQGPALEVRGDGPAIRIPPRRWRDLLEANRGGEVTVEVAVRSADGAWTRFEPVRLGVAREPIDRYLVYRLMGPIYNKYVHLGIYQRDLEGYAETALLKNTEFGGGCLNCHTFCRNDPSRMTLQVRGSYGNVMVLSRGGETVKVDTRCGLSPAPAAYTSWHPSGRLLAFSMNKLSIFFHAVGENRDVFDHHSDLGIYLADTGTVSTTDAISLPERNETWPAWSADGRHLYFCAAPKMPQERFRDVRYDLMRIGYDVESGTWGALETVLAAADAGRSLLEPRPSPDGRWLLFCTCDYGNFPIYQASCDLVLMDLATGTYRPLECNSDRADSYHAWSSNSRWIVFSSKRADGVFAQPHFSYIDSQGRASKPFVLPQEDPAFYDSCVRTYNAPELVTAPVPVSRREFARVICEPGEAESLKAQLDPSVPPRVSPGGQEVKEPYAPGGPEAGGPPAAPRSDG